MSMPATLPAPVVELLDLDATKWEREYKAFRCLLPQLLASHQGQYVAIHDGKVIEHGSNKLEVALRALARLGNVAIHVGLVSDATAQVSRSGVRREVKADGDLP